MPARKESNMFEKFRLERKIKKAVNKTVKEIENSIPKISGHFFYGSVDISPNNLVIWYLFNTNDELALAKENGLCEQLTERTTQNLLDESYPKEAFEKTKMQAVEKITYANEVREQIDNIMESFLNKKVMISFTTEQDIEEKANGDCHLYFQ